MYGPSQTSSDEHKQTEQNRNEDHVCADNATDLNGQERVVQRRIRQNGMATVEMLEGNLPGDRIAEEEDQKHWNGHDDEPVDQEIKYRQACRGVENEAANL